MSNKTFRLFISSTFSDFVKEREILHTKVFPVINDYCINYGYDFQPIDLRWGINTEAQLDQKTIEMCLEEVRLCKHYPHPNFLIMLGDRYGYIPCPYMIEFNEFQKIKKVTKEEHLPLLEYWYKLDLNQIYITQDNQKSTAYILQPRVRHYKRQTVWEKQEKKLKKVLQNAAEIIFEDHNNIENQKYFMSATEREVLEGICDYKYKTKYQKDCNKTIDKKYIYGYVRTIESFDNKYSETEELLRTKTKKFKFNLTQTLKKENLFFSNYINASLYENNDFLDFTKFMIKSLKKAINIQKKQLDNLSLLEQEILEEKKFQQDKLRGFQGRKKILSSISKYINKNNTDFPIVVHGASGAGKSSVMAKAIEETIEISSEKSIIMRFVGATLSSTTIRNLLISICDELCLQRVISKIYQYENDENKFYEQIKMILESIRNPTIIFIDALDQLQNKEFLHWLPNKLPHNLKMVFSVLKDNAYKEDSQYYDLFKEKYNEKIFIDINNDSLLTNSDTLLRELLSLESRTLEDSQYQYVLNQWSQAGYSPLFLKIVIEEVKHWKSYDAIFDKTKLYKQYNKQSIGRSVENVILEFIHNLSGMYHHETKLIKKVLGYILVSKNGLSEKELIEILSEDLEDDTSLQKALLSKYHNPIKINNPRRNKKELALPFSIWSGLHSQLKPFLIERNIDNQPLIKFFHRQFTTAIEKYLHHSKDQLHSKMASYFSTLQVQASTWERRYHNPHMIDELPYQLFYAKKIKELESLLCNLEFAGVVYNMNKQETFKEVFKQTRQLDTISKSKIATWESFYREKEHLFVKINDNLWKPHQSLYQLAYEDGTNSPLYHEANFLLINNKVPFSWMRRINVPVKFNRNGLLKVFYGHKKSINGIYVLKDGRILSYSDDTTLRLWSNKENTFKLFLGHTDKVNGALVFDNNKILSYSDDHSMILWNTYGNQLCRFFGHTGSILGAIILDEEKILSYSSDKSMILWDYFGNKVCQFKGHTETIKGVKIFNNNIISFSDDATIRIWSYEGYLLKTLIGHKQSINGIEILNDKQFISFSNDTTLIIWSHDGEKLKILEGHTNSIKGINILENTKIVSYSYDSTLRIWDKDGNHLKTLLGHKWTVTGVIELDDGNLVSSSGDDSLKIWTQEGKLLKTIHGHTKYILKIEKLDDSRIISFSRDNTIRIWDLEGNALDVLEGHSDHTLGAELLDNNKILSFSKDATIRLWDTNQQSLINHNDHQGSIRGLTFLDSKILSYSDDRTLRLWDEKGNLLKVFEGHEDWVNNAELTESGNIFTFSRYDKTMKLWDINANCLQTFEGHTSWIRGAKVLMSNRFISYSEDRTIRLWNNNAQCLTCFVGHEGAVDGAFQFNISKYVSYSKDMTLRMWDEEGNCLKVMKGHQDIILGVVILENKTILSYSKDMTLRMWDEEGNCLKVMKGHQDIILGVVILENKTILSYSKDMTLRMWDEEGNCLKAMKGHNTEICSVFLVKREIIVSQSLDNVLKFWDINGNFLNKQYYCPAENLKIFKIEGNTIVAANGNRIVLYSL